MLRYEFMPDGRTVVEKLQGLYEDYEDVLSLKTLDKLKKGEFFRFASRRKESVSKRVWVFEGKSRGWLSYQASDDMNHRTTTRAKKLVVTGFQH
jgi:hypothetical protein